TTFDSTHDGIDNRCYLLSFPTRRSSDLRIRARCNRSTRYRWPFSNQQIVSLVFSCDGVGVGRVEKCELDFYRAVKEVLRNSAPRSEEHTSELQSRFELVCRLLLEKNNTK